MAGLNVGKLKQKILNYYKPIIENLAERFSDVLAREFGGIVGEIPLAWISKAINEIMVYDISETDGTLSCEVGWKYSSLWEEVRVLVGLYGNQHGGPLKVKPGIATWDHNLMGEKNYNPEKDILGEKLLPAAFNHDGIDALSNAEKIFEVEFLDAIEQAKDNLPLLEFMEECLL